MYFSARRSRTTAPRLTPCRRCALSGVSSGMMEPNTSKLPRLPNLMGILVAAALGLNAWATLLLVPVLHSASLGKAHPPRHLWLLALPLPLLLLGLIRLSRPLLLALFPMSLGVLVAVYRGPTGRGLFTVWTFGVAAISLLGYLLGSTIILEVRARRDDAVGSRALPLPPLSPKWKRRRRVYLMLAAFAAMIPLALIYTIDFHPATAQTLRAEYGTGAEEMQTLFVVCALGFWLWIFSTFFMAPLEEHRRGDLALRRELAALDQRSRRARPRRSFYLVVAAALGMMGLLLWMRQRYG